MSTFTAMSAQQLAQQVSLAGIAPMGPWAALLEIGTRRITVNYRDHQLAVDDGPTINDSWDFTFAVTTEEWDSFCSVPVPRGFTSAQALVATRGPERVRGSRAVWARAALVVDRLLAALRELERTEDDAPTAVPPIPRDLGLSPIVGRYVTVDVAGRNRRIYFETAGSGLPLLCLHTAGADSRQFRWMLEDEELTSRHQVIAFDMPWHGRSDPDPMWNESTYRLTTETYAATILAVCDALGLAAPVLLGCSMGGAIALYMASRHGERFTGVCALEGGLGNPGRFVEWTNRSDVDHSYFLTSWVGGLIAPTSPRSTRDQTLWGYAQSGPGVYQGDTYFYSHDFPQHADDLPRASCPLYVFSGEYDYSATLEMSREAADRLGGELIDMRGKGHFPMAEDPVSFAQYLYPVLDKIAAASPPA